MWQFCFYDQCHWSVLQLETLFIAALLSPKKEVNLCFPDSEKNYDLFDSVSPCLENICLLIYQVSPLIGLISPLRLTHFLSWHKLPSPAHIHIHAHLLSLFLIHFLAQHPIVSKEEDKVSCFALRKVTKGSYWEKTYFFWSCFIEKFYDFVIMWFL